MKSNVEHSPAARPGSALLTLLGLTDRQLQLRILTDGGIAAIASVASLVSLSRGLKSWFENGSADLPFVLCCAALAVNYIFSQRFVASLLRTSITAITEVRRELLQRATLSSWSSLQAHQQARSFEHCQRLLEQVAVLLPGMSVAANMLILTLVAYAYFATISIPGALLILLGIAVLASRHVSHMTSARGQLREAEVAAERIAGGLGEIMRGSVEIRLGKARRDTMLGGVAGAIDRWDRLRGEHGAAVAELFSWINVFLVILSAMVVFIFPRLGIVSLGELPTLTMVLLFLIRPLAKFLNAVPDIVAAEDAARRVAEICVSLPKPEFTPGPRQATPLPFAEIQLAGVEYAYPGTAGGTFSVGPVDLTIKAGDVVGIFGSNGSGKSTLLKMIPLLIQPDKGEILLDGLPADAAGLEAYRDLFCGVFQDDHVFSTLPADASGFDRGVFYDMLDFLDIGHLVQVDDAGRLDYTLSRGQRRRLALAIAIAEGRRIIILDEWTADQDQSYRLRFRGEIMAMLRQRGLTVVFVSHDEHAAELCTTTLFLSGGRMLAAAHPLVEAA